MYAGGHIANYDPQLVVDIGMSWLNVAKENGESAGIGHTKANARYLATPVELFKKLARVPFHRWNVRITISAVRDQTRLSKRRRTRGMRWTRNDAYMDSSKRRPNEPELIRAAQRVGLNELLGQ